MSSKDRNQSEKAIGMAQKTSIGEFQKIGISPGIPKPEENSGNIPMIPTLGEVSRILSGGGYPHRKFFPKPKISFYSTLKRYRSRFTGTVTSSDVILY